MYSKHFHFFLIVRNPYDKVESFFREKFRKSLDYYDKNGFWQDSQQLFFPYLNIDASMSPEVIREIIKNTSFNAMVSPIPEVYMRDDHLLPQCLKASVAFKILKFDISIPIRIRKIFKLESKENLQELNKIFEINTESVVNATSSVDEDIIWTIVNRALINTIYKRDFELFNYKQKSE